MEGESVGFQLERSAGRLRMSHLNETGMWSETEQEREMERGMLGQGTRNGEREYANVNNGEPTAA